MDVENFKRLFLPLHPKLFRIAYALVENKADAEDILQDAYYKLWSRRNELTDIQNPEAFCVTLVKNLCLDFLRSPRANRRDADVTEAVTLSTCLVLILVDCVLKKSCYRLSINVKKQTILS